MKNKGLKSLLIIFILFCIIWCSYKVFLLYDYKPNDHTYIKERLESIKDISITSNKSLSNFQFVNMNLFVSDEYKEYKPATFQEHGTDFEQKLFSSDNGTIDIWLKKSSLKIDSLLPDLKFDAKELMKKYNISDEIDFFRYFKDQKSTKRNIFWSKSKIQMDYLVSLYLDTSFSDGQNSEDYNFITNDLDGIMTTGNNYRLVYLLNGNEQYELRFNKKTFTKEQVLDILKSVYFL